MCDYQWLCPGKPLCASLHLTSFNNIAFETFPNFDFADDPISFQAMHRCMWRAQNPEKLSAFQTAKSRGEITESNTWASLEWKVVIWCLSPLVRFEKLTKIFRTWFSTSHAPRVMSSALALFYPASFLPRFPSDEGQIIGWLIAYLWLVSVCYTDGWHRPSTRHSMLDCIRNDNGESRSIQPLAMQPCWSW